MILLYQYCAPFILEYLPNINLARAGEFGLVGVLFGVSVFMDISIWVTFARGLNSCLFMGCICRVLGFGEVRAQIKLQGCGDPELIWSAGDVDVPRLFLSYKIYHYHCCRYATLGVHFLLLWFHI